MSPNTPQSSLSLTPQAPSRCDTGLSLLAVTGADASDFLHGQFSNDLKSLSVGQSQISSYSSAKGRVLALFEIARTDDGFLIALPTDILEPVRKRLQMFVLRADVTLSPLTATPVTGLVGEGAEAALAEAGLPVPEVNKLTVDGDVTVWALSGAASCYLVLGETDALNELSKSDSGTWTMARIAAAVPSVTAATQDAYVAQQLNVDRIGGINFKKGCYPGQEVIARMHYLGKPSRRLFAYRASGAAPAVGAELRTASGEEAGSVVASAAAGEGAAILAVMKLKTLEAGAALSTADGASVTALDLPYTLEDPAETTAS